MKKIELFYLVIGLLLGICLMFFINAIGKESSGGRYKMQTAKFAPEEYIYILDTETGKAIGYDFVASPKKHIDFQSDYKKYWEEEK